MVADHDTRVYGDELVPVSKFHIPGLILGSDIKPRTISAISSQIDLAPTLLSLAGISAYLPMVGQDLSQPDVQPANRAMMQFGDNYGWLEQHINGPRLTVLHVDKSVKQFRYQSSSQSLAPIEGKPQPEHIRKVQAFAMLPSILYQQRAYFVPRQ